MKRFFPFLDWLPGYKKDNLKYDIPAGITVGVMLIPQGMAYALIAGVPPIFGLYASMLPLVIYALLGTSRQLSVGPTAMVGLLIIGGLEPISEAGSLHFIELAILLGLLVGLIQLFAGILRLGFMINFLSHPVTVGFTSAAAVIIGVSQIKHLLRIEVIRSEHIHEIIPNILENIAQSHIPTLLVGVGSFLIMILVKKIRRTLPAPLIAVVYGILVVGVFGLHDLGIKIVGEVPEGLPPIGIPDVNMDVMAALLPTALAIALMGFMESVAIAKTIELKHHDHSVDANQEMMAIGMSNIGGAFTSGFPVAGSFARSAVNDQMGAKTGLSSIITAALIALTLLFLTPLFYYLPQAVLGAIIMMAVFNLIDIRTARFLWKSNRKDFLMMLATFFATLSIGILEGIFIGVGLSVIMVIYQSTRPHYAVMGRLPDTNYYRNVRRFKEVKQIPNILIFRFDTHLYFANVNFFKDTIKRLVRKNKIPVKLIIINAESIHSIDSTACHAIDELVNHYRRRDIQVYFTGVVGPVRDTMYRSGLFPKIGRKKFFMRVHDAVSHFENPQTVDDHSEARQTSVPAKLRLKRRKKKRGFSKKK